MAAQVQDLVRKMEKDYEAAPYCGTVRIMYWSMLIELGPRARPYIEAARDGSPVCRELDLVLEQIPRKREGCACLVCREEF